MMCFKQGYHDLFLKRKKMKDQSYKKKNGTGRQGAGIRTIVFQL